MAVTILLTPQPIRLLGNQVQPLYLARDVSAFDLLDLELICSIEGTSSVVAFYLVTQMEIDTEDGANYLAFPNMPGTGPQAATLSLTGGFLRYIRWSLSNIGTATAVTFTMMAQARTFEEAVGG